MEDIVMVTRDSRLNAYSGTEITIVLQCSDELVLHSSCAIVTLYNNVEHI